MQKTAGKRESDAAGMTMERYLSAALAQPVLPPLLFLAFFSKLIQ